MRVFVDSNIFVYLFDSGDPARQQLAKQALETSHEIVVSTQVLLEFYAVIRRKFGLTYAEAAIALSKVDYPTIATDRALVERAVELANLNQLSIFDAMIVAAAANASCDELWTEDLGTGMVLAGVRVTNPLDR